MAGPQNPSFESPGLEAGQADQWVETYDDGGNDIALFGSYPFPFDGFDEWFGSQDAQDSFEQGDTYPALFEGADEGLAHAKETFNFSWAMPGAAGSPPKFNHMFITDLDSPGSTEAASFDAASDDDEDFENGWSDNEDFKSYYGIGGATSVLCQFGPAMHELDAEGFDERWSTNQDFQTSFGPGDTTVCNFNTTDPDGMAIPWIMEAFNTPGLYPIGGGLFAHDEGWTTQLTM